MDAGSSIITFILRYWPLVSIVAATAFLLVSSLLILRTVFARRYLARRAMTWLEITPPLRILKTPEATEQLFSVLHGMRAARSIKERLLGRNPVMSFEIVSTRREGIRYLVHVELPEAIY